MLTSDGCTAHQGTEEHKTNHEMMIEPLDPKEQCLEVAQVVLRPITDTEQRKNYRPAELVPKDDAGMQTTASN